VHRIKKSKLNHIFLIIGTMFLGLLMMGATCFNRTRRDNYHWQLDSLRYYTIKFDSLLMIQSNEMSQLRVDLYTKSNELSEKIEMLSSRLSDTEVQLTRIYENVGTGTKAPADSEDISQISPEARLIYESAYLNYVKGNYTDAIKGFQSYLDIQPDSPLSDNAFYWIGESYAAMGKRQDAVDTFQELIKKYPQSSKVPTALYRTGVIYEEANDNKTAKTFYNKLIKDFPNSPEAAIAKDKLQ
jgi:tol-pal system protein YbgF